MCWYGFDLCFTNFFCDPFTWHNTDRESDPFRLATLNQKSLGAKAHLILQLFSSHMITALLIKGLDHHNFSTRSHSILFNMNLIICFPFSFIFHVKLELRKCSSRKVLSSSPSIHIVCVSLIYYHHSQ